ncbi:hypothetical protein [Bifidobacterium stellenboschense]|uniref:Uncharacterized protein n=1 Tax=Bifidobacterium stellenboschense TaxID=762211 RepID=A0A087E0N2_9BIFI|nr:hypothetical protein [Bifidobacterium stellenboschense]KFJ01333.1 hypothetical protein BSTEL_1462 [Bifidobacterium stellenboschense]
MFDVDKVRRIIAERNATDNEWDDRIEQCWNRLVEEMSKDPQQASSFILDCSDEELSTIGEILDELVWHTQSSDIVKSFRTAIRLHPEESKRFHLNETLDDAIKSMLKDRSQMYQLITWRPTAEEVERLRHTA